MERIPLKNNSTGQGLMLTTFAMLALGVVMVHSAVGTVSAPGHWYSRPDFRHTLFAALAAAVLGAGWLLDYHKLAAGKRWPWLATILLAASLLSAGLVLVPGIGRSVGGFRRFIRLGPDQYAIGFQPSELIKFVLVIFLAAWLCRMDKDRVRRFVKTFIPAVIIMGLGVGVIVREDFSTGAVAGMAAALTLLLAGVPWYYMLTLVPPAAAGFWKLVYTDPYRWNRITAMFNPWDQSIPATYQARESLIAILTGGWTGKGLGQGMQKLGFLPEDSSDFIYSVFCEEWGFVGAALLMGLVLLWIWHARRAAVRAGDKFGAVLAGSLGFLIAIQAVMHIAVALVMVPTTGMGLPFVSAGGTSLVITAGAVAIMVSVTAHRATTPQEQLEQAAQAGAAAA